MKKLSRIWFMLLVLAVTLVAGTQAKALTYNLTTEFSGGTSPVGTAPWLTAILAQNGANTVRLTMTDTNLTGSEFVDEWLFNLDPLKNATSLSFSYVSGIVAAISTVANNSNSIPGDGGGYYDIKFDFPAGPPTSRFGVSDSSVYDITLTGLTEADFNFLAAPHGGNGVWHTAAHVQSIGTQGGSGWIGDEGGGGGGGGNPVPEPGTLLLLGVGLFGLTVFGKRKLNR